MDFVDLHQRWKDSAALFEAVQLHLSHRPDVRWPQGCCTCCIESEVLQDRLVEHWPTICPVVGRFDGNWHAFMQTRDGTIVDPTIGQFVAGPSCRVIYPDDPLHARFVVDDRNTNMWIERTRFAGRTRFAVEVEA